ncbi:MAG: tetratricopeptide repeat protein [Chitinispirillaceae bacterium]|nr:tetratricopeptide repeat protein [Chitinispirillaceae bacterium]
MGGLSLCIPLLLFLFSCSPPPFPVLHPVQSQSRGEMSRAKAETYFIMARDLERRGLHREAERFYTLAYDFDPASRVLRDQLVRIYIDAGKLTQAVLLVKGNRAVDELDSEEKRVLAGIYIKSGEFQRAIETLESIADPAMNDYYSLAIMYESIGNGSKALRNYLAFFGRNRGSLELGLKVVRMLIDARHYDAADSLTLLLVKEHGEKAPLLDIQGVVALSRGDTAAAIDCFNQALAVDSTWAEAARNAAQVFLRRSDYAQSIIYYRLLYRRGLYYEQVYGRTLAILYYYHGEFAAAEDLLKKLLESSYDDPDLHYHLGLVFAATGRTDEARLQIEKTVVLNPGMDDAWRERCYLAIREKKLDEALAVAERWVRRSPRTPSSWRLKGTVLNMRKEHGRALKAFRAALSLDSSDAAAWFELASSYERFGNIDKAAVTFKKVLTLKPDDPATLNYLGYMWAEKGIKLDSAARLIAAALARDPDNGAYLDSYAWIFYQKGDFDAAYDYITRAIARIDNDPVVYEHLGDILVKRNDLTAAATAYRRSLELKAEDEDGVRMKIMHLVPFIKTSLPSGVP